MRLDLLVLLHSREEGGLDDGGVGEGEGGGGGAEGEGGLAVGGAGGVQQLVAGHAVPFLSLAV